MSFSKENEKYSTRKERTKENDKKYNTMKDNKMNDKKYSPYSTKKDNKMNDKKYSSKQGGGKRKMENIVQINERKEERNNISTVQWKKDNELQLIYETLYKQLNRKSSLIFLSMKTTQLSQKQISSLAFHLIFCRFSLFNCRLNGVL